MKHFSFQRLLQRGKSLGTRLLQRRLDSNLVPRACDPWEGNEGSGIIRCRKPGILAKIELRIHFNGQSDSSLKRIIPEPSFPSQGSQARGTRLVGQLISELSRELSTNEIALFSIVLSAEFGQENLHSTENKSEKNINIKFSCKISSVVVLLLKIW